MKRIASYRKQQQLYEEIINALASFEDIDPAIVGFAASGEIVYANRSTCDLLGFPKEKLQGRPFQTIAPEITGQAWDSFWSGLDRENSEQKPTRLRLSGKRELSIEFQALFVHESGLKFCIMTKSGERPAACVSGKTHSWPLVQVLNNMANPAAIRDEQRKIIFMNQAHCQWLGTTAAEASGTTVFDYLPKKYADLAWKQQQHALDSGRPSKFVGDRFFQIKYGESVTVLPFLVPGTSEKQLLVIVNKPAQLAFPPPMVIAESHERVPSRSTPGYGSELHEILDRSSPLGIFLKNTENRYLWVNQAFARMSGFEPKNIIGRRVEDLVSDPEMLSIIRTEDDYIYSTGKPLLNQVAPLFINRPRYCRRDKLPFINKSGKLVGIIGLVVELDEPAPSIEALKKELRSMSQKLQETETALRVIIERREQDVSLTREELNAKVRDLLVPYLENLKQAQLTSEQAEFVELIETNLKNFYDPANARLSSPSYRLSPTELKVAQLIRDGKTNKEIAKLLHLSKSTILTHRHHVRAKLGIKNQKINLRSLLNS